MRTKSVLFVLILSIGHLISQVVYSNTTASIDFKFTTSYSDIQAAYSNESHAIVVVGEELIGLSYSVLDTKGRKLKSGQFNSNPETIKTRLTPSQSYLVVITDKTYVTIHKIISIEP